MVEVTLNLGSLEKGSISDSGSKVTSSSSVRTSDYVTGNDAFYECDVECGIVVKDDIEGSFSGDSSWRNPIPDCPTTFGTVKTDNPNDTCEYYHFVRTCIEPPSQTFPHGRTRQWAGYMINLYPTIGFNHEGNVPRFMYRYDNEFQSSDAVSGSKSYVSIDMSGDGLITYYKSGTSGETVTKTIFELLFGEKDPDNDDTLSINLAGSRGSKAVSADIALIGYNANNQAVYNKRWGTTDADRPYIENIINYLPITKWKFVFKNEEYYSDIKVEYILNPSVKLRADSWEMTQDNILVNSGMCEEISGDILTYPFPKSFWELDENNKLEMFMLPEPYAENHSIVHDNPDGTEYFNQHSNAYDSALSNLNNNYRIRLEILTDEETVIGEITKDLSLTAAGQITINYEQITRRSCSLSLINVDNKYIPTKNSPFWLNRKFKLWLGLVVGKDTYWWSQGIFYTVSANATGRILSIEGVDKGGALDGTLKLNMTEAQYQFKRGKALTEMIKQTLALDVGNPYGANNSPIGFGGNRPIDSQPPLIGIEYYGFNTVADISIDANSYISEMFVNMAELYAADCYYNTNGNLVFEQHIDSSGYNYVPTQWSFTDLSSTFEDVNYEYSYEGENVVTVYTNTTEAGVRNVAWTAYNTNPLSPLNVATGIRRASHIEIPYYHNEQLSQDQQEAQQIKDCRSTANHYLLANSMLGMTLNFNAPIIPHMDVNKTIQISDRYADIEDGIYVVQSITIPLSSDKMQISATNINWLPNDMTFGGVSEIVQSNSNQNGGAET